MAATGWQAHSVRGFVRGHLVKNMKLRVQSFRREGERVLLGQGLEFRSLRKRKRSSPSSGLCAAPNYGNGLGFHDHGIMNLVAQASRGVQR